MPVTSDSLCLILSLFLSLFLCVHKHKHKHKHKHEHGHGRATLMENTDSNDIQEDEKRKDAQDQTGKGEMKSSFSLSATQRRTLAAALRARDLLAAGLTAT